MTGKDAIIAPIRWLGGFGFFILGKPAVYINPTHVPDGLPKADIIFITDIGEGRFSRKDVEKLSTPQTIVAGPKACVSSFRLNQMPMSAGQNLEILSLPVRALASGASGDERLGFFMRWPWGALYCPGPAASLELEEGISPYVLLFSLDGDIAHLESIISSCPKNRKPNAVIPMGYRLPQDRKKLDGFRQIAGDLSAELEPWKEGGG